MSKIFVDFDSTITNGSGSPWWVDPLDEEPREEMVELVNNLYKQGYAIIIYTARREDVRDETEYYLNKWGVMYHALRMNKPGYRLLIDDRAINDETALEMSSEKISEEYVDAF
jgi:histidinol phosphatase-like enzyme